ncbi:MAG: AEC family transporter, partial [Pigmentiphaga sp.]
MMPALIAFYLSTLVLLAPMLTCVGVGLYWGKRQLPFSANFLALLVTSVSTPALVFHTLVTTELDNAVLLELGGISVLVLFVCAVVCGLAL